MKTIKIITIIIMLSSCATVKYKVQTKDYWKGEFTYQYMIVNETDTIQLRTNRDYKVNDTVKRLITPNLFKKRK